MLPKSPLYFAALATLLAIPRSAIADNVFWAVDASGNWTTPSNWSSNPNLPGPNDDVTIDRPAGVYTVTLTGSQTVHSLFNNESLTVAGTLITATTASGFIFLNGGTLRGGTMTGSGISTATFSGSGTLDGLTLVNSTVTYNGPNFTILNNLTLSNSTVSATRNDHGPINIPGTQSITGSGTLTIPVFNGSPFGNPPTLLTGGALTIGPGITLLSTGSVPLTISTSSLINNGLVDLRTATTISGTLVNNGTLSISSGSLPPTSITNLAGSGGGHISGYVAITNTSTAALNLPGVSGTVYVSGTLDNTNQILNLDNSSPLYFGYGYAGPPPVVGTLKGGTLSLSGTKLLNAATLDGVTIASTDPTYGFTIKNGLTLNNALVSIAYSLSSPYQLPPTLTASGPQTISGTGTLSFDVTTGAGGILSDSTLTLAPGITLIPNKQDVSLQVPTLINQGTISLPTGRTLFINNSTSSPSTSFTSIGTISGPGNITFNASSNNISGTFNVTGTTTLGPGALVTFNPGTYKLSFLTLATTSKLDLTSSTLIFQTTSPSDKSSKLLQLKSAITANIASNWTAKGITSSTVAQDPTHYTLALLDNATLQLTTFNGQPVDSNSLLLAFAHLGDTNANGAVDIQDQSLITNHWQTAQNNWSTGDLNLDGFTDIQDLTLVTNNWQQQSSFSLDSSPSSSPTPEPLSLPVLVLALPLVLRRNPQKHNAATRSPPLTSNPNTPLEK